MAVKATPVSSSSYQASAGNHFPSRLFKNSSAEPDTASSDMFYEGSDVNISFLDGFLRLVGVAYHDQQQQRHEYERFDVFFLFLFSFFAFFAFLFVASV